MKLKGSPLTLNSRGREVAQLHRELRQLNFIIPDDEVRRALFGRGTRQAVIEFQQSRRLVPNGIVDRRTAAALDRNLDVGRARVVRGTVTDGRRPLSGIVVRAVNVRLRREEPLGEDRTAEDGAFEIRYNAPANLLLRAFAGGSEPLLTTDVIYKAKAVETVDLTVQAPARTSEFEEHLANVRPLLENVAIDALDGDDVERLSGESGIAELELAWVVVAHQHARATNIDAAAFYGLFRQSLPTDLRALLLQPPAQWRAALQRSVEQSVIPARSAADVDRIVALLQRQVADRVLRDPAGDVALPRLLGVAGLTPAEQNTFLQQHLQHEGTSDEFWTSLRNTPLAAKARNVQSALQLGLVTRNNAALVAALQGRNVTSARDLARLDRAELQRLVQASGEALASIPSEENETDEQKAARYAGEVLETLHAAMPTAFLRASYERAGDAVRRGVARVLDNAPELELRDEPIDRFLADNPRALDGIERPEEVRLHLKRVQRAFRVAPRADHAEALIGEGLDSAHAVTSMSPAAFEERFAERMGGAAVARAYHAKARQISETAIGTLAAVKQAVYDVMPAAVGAAAILPASLPNLTNLFGSQSFCACDDCGSVLGPAAYLVDLLQFISPKRGPRPIERLRQLRPDIEHIPLTCDNTNTAVPYVDLVNEILEFFVANGRLTGNAARNTTGSSEALRVQPEHVVDAAYDELAEQVHPPQLPFHRPLTMTRLYLEHLGTSRAELMRTFQRNGQPSDAQIDLESLGLSARERNILTGQTQVPLATFYGFPATQNPSQFSTRVSDFMKGTGTTYDEVEELLKTRFLDPQGTIGLRDLDDPPQCDLTRRVLTGATPEFWSRAHRVVRLQRKIGWSFRELDLAFRTFDAAEITLPFLSALGAVQRLRKTWKLPADVLLGFWGELDIRGKDPLYERLFMSRLLPSAGDDAFLPGRLAGSTIRAIDRAATIAAALRLAVPDLHLLLRHLGHDPAQVTLSMPLLSALHRHAVLARALKLKVADYVALIEISGQQPFPSADPRATEEFVELARAVQKSGFRVATLQYLFSNAGSPPAPPAESVAAVLKTLRAGLAAVAEKERPSEDVTADPLRPRLTAVLGEELAAQAVGIIDRAPTLTPEEIAFVDEHLAPFTNVSELVDRAALLQRLSAYERRGIIVQTLSEDLGTASGAMRLLVEETLNDFLALEFVTDDEIDQAQSDAVRAARSSYLRAHRAALLVNGFAMTEEELRHFGFDPDGLSFAQWRRLAAVYAVRNELPQRDGTLAAVFAAGTRQAAVGALRRASGWDEQELAFLTSRQGFHLEQAADFRDETRIARIAAALRLARRIGAPVATLFRWAAGEPDPAAAREVVETVKAKYLDEEWPAVAKPINDVLRELQKSALVADVLRRTGLEDSNQLFSRFLIDVEMSACMETSRIKQAISSVQLFVQRCLMHLEPGEDASPTAIDAEEWEWMKNYRVWEANRKVFLYPENWIEPELRDNKSPFFAELETELLQNELTSATAENAFIHYLEKLEQVARLEICGLYVQSPQDDDDEEVVHVFGRTKQTPHIHYYRTLVDGRTWMPWEKIELDIEGDHLLPVVHDRRLYLFWLHFEEKLDELQELPLPYIQSIEHWRWLRIDHPAWEKKHEEWRDDHNLWTSEKALKEFIEHFNRTVGPDLEVPELRDEPVEPREPEEPPFSVLPPLTHGEVKLVWSEYRNGEWSAAQTSPDPVISPAVRKSMPGFFVEEAGMGGALILGSMNEQYQILRKDEAGNVVETIFSTFVPGKEQHFLRTRTESGRLIVEVHRRYEHEQSILQLFDVSVKGYEIVGRFELHCGGKVQSRSFTDRRDYDELARPENTTNRAMSFLGAGDAKTLTFSADGKRRDIFGGIPDDDYLVLPEHATGAFRLKPPYDDFFFQDGRKTYYARYQAPSFSQVVSRPAVGGMTMPRGGAGAPLIRTVGGRGAKTRRSVSALGTGQRRTFGTQRVGRAALGARSATAQMQAAPTRALQRGGMRLGTVAAKALHAVGESAHTMKVMPDDGLLFQQFFHPHVCTFIERLHRYGVSGLLARDTQQLDADGGEAGNLFQARYAPTGEVARPYPREHVDFGRGPYALYNWELFFHIPLLIAQSLMQNQRFDEAMEWFHFIFNPTTTQKGRGVQRFWNTLPFFLNSDPARDQVEQLLLTLTEKRAGWKEVEEQIEEWRENPFNPHLIARLRMTAYQKNVVMKYVQNLIAWGDQLFSRDTIESINEATLLYVLAHDILGPRPQPVPRQEKVAPRSFRNLAGDLDAFGNALVEAENILPMRAVSPKISAMSRARTMAHARAPKLSMTSTRSLSATGGMTMVQQRETTLSKVGVGGFRPAVPLRVVQSAVQAFYFCVPKNEELLRYWDTVDDRLFKIRHCMNIERVVRTLPLFEPPIDPALLVKAAAAGLDLGSVLNDLYAPLPQYRFTFTLQKALELCNELKSFSGALLTALEKKDAEALSNLKAAHETSLLRAMRDVKLRQIDEAKTSIESLQKTQAVTEKRHAFYRDVARISSYEKLHLDQLDTAHTLQQVAQGIIAGVAAGFMLPNIDIGTEGWTSSPVAKVSFGGNNVGQAIRSAADWLTFAAGIHSHEATVASILGGYERRWDEWKLQEELSEAELSQIEKQIAAAEIRQAIAELDLVNHDRQIENSAATEEFLRGKYTGEALYAWMTGQISKVYFQAYQLAYELAKRAERSYRHELGLKDSGFVRFGYWDNLKRGLLAGEQLALDLKRMEASYLDQNRREYELTKNVSLMLHAPLELLRLKETGVCDELELPETLFDADYPGHYMRRIKSVSLTIPAVVGPYTGVNCTLTLLSSRTRFRNVRAADGREDEQNFAVTHAAQASIATSHAQNDSGMFELNFRDERYLPFEGMGAAGSKWRIELPKENNAFDLSTISDVILHIRYTAREGGEAFRNATREHLAAILADAASSRQARVFSMKTEFPTEWHSFLRNPAPVAGALMHRISLDLSRERFPFLFRGKTLAASEVRLFLKLKPGVAYDAGDPLRLRADVRHVEPGDAVNVTSPLPAGTQQPEFTLPGPVPDLPSVALPGGDVDLRLTMEVHEADLPATPATPATWWDSVTTDGTPHKRLKAAAIDDVLIVCRYAVT